MGWGFLNNLQFSECWNDAMSALGLPLGRRSHGGVAYLWGALPGWHESGARLNMVVADGNPRLAHFHHPSRTWRQGDFAAHVTSDHPKFRLVTEMFSESFGQVAPTASCPADHWVLTSGCLLHPCQEDLWRQTSANFLAYLLPTRQDATKYVHREPAVSVPVSCSKNSNTCSMYVDAPSTQCGFAMAFAWLLSEAGLQRALHHHQCPELLPVVSIEGLLGVAGCDGCQPGWWRTHKLSLRWPVTQEAARSPDVLCIEVTLPTPAGDRRGFALAPMAWGTLSIRSRLQDTVGMVGDYTAHWTAVSQRLPASLAAWGKSVAGNTTCMLAAAHFFREGSISLTEVTTG